jgi:predicted metal-dependent hydrolase
MPSFIYKGKEMHYAVSESNRKTLGIYVHPNLEVEVKTPVYTLVHLIAEKVEKRKRWIVKRLAEFEKFHPKTEERKYLNGETHKYLGRQYRLKIESSNNQLYKEPRVSLKGAYIWVYTQENKPVQPLIDDWYKKKANNYLKKRFEYWGVHLSKELPVQPELSIKKLSKSWGLCKGNQITLNSELIKVPRLGIDYVIIHELCHLKVPYHNEDFKALLSKHLPEWQKHKEILELSYS